MDITPVTPIRMAGYGARLKESEGVADPIFARALVIGGDRKFTKDKFASEKTSEFMGSGQGALLEPDMTIVVSVESCGVPDTLTNRLCEELATRFGVTRQRIAVCSTHSHSAPWLREFSPLHISQVTPEQNQRLAQYEVELLDELVKVVTQAVESRRPGRLEWGTTNLDFAINRRRLDGGRWVGFGAVPDGPVDHRMPLLSGRCCSIQQTTRSNSWPLLFFGRDRTRTVRRLWIRFRRRENSKEMSREELTSLRRGARPATSLEKLGSNWVRTWPRCATARPIRC